MSGKRGAAGTAARQARVDDPLDRREFEPRGDPEAVSSYLANTRWKHSEGSDERARRSILCVKRTMIWDEREISRDDPPRHRTRLVHCDERRGLLC